MQIQIKIPQEKQTVKIQEAIRELFKMKAISCGNIPNRFQTGTSAETILGLIIMNYPKSPWIFTGRNNMLYNYQLHKDSILGIERQPVYFLKIPLVSVQQDRIQTFLSAKNPDFENFF